MPSFSLNKHEAEMNAYERLNEILSRNQDLAVEVEVIPPEFSPDDPILEEGNSLGLVKSFFVAAFIRAREIFDIRSREKYDRVSQSLLRTNREGSKYVNIDCNYFKSDLDATRIILLFSPEHLTAANFRKRALLSGIAEHGIESATSDMIYSHELALLDTILMSHLPRQTKSPTLWHHRYWLHTTFMPRILELNRKGPDQRPSLLIRELNCVLKSGERHPKNFYAWQYMRNLVKLVSGTVDICDRPAFIEEMNTVAVCVQDWCLRHVSDVSGWAFLIFFLHSYEVDTKKIVALVSETLNLAINLRWDNESVWYFLRTMIASGIFPERDQLILLHKIEVSRKTKLLGTPNTPKDNAAKWIYERAKEQMPRECEEAQGN